jgi:hypothetical protein
MATLSSAELIRLLKVLNLNETLERVDENFNKTFTKPEQFRIGCGICFLLQDQMLTKCQRIAAFSILCNLYRTELTGKNPFLLFFLDSVEQGNDPIEKKFLIHLLCSAPSNRESSKKLAADIISDSSKSSRELVLPDVNALRQLYQEQTPIPKGVLYTRYLLYHPFSVF